MFWRMYAGNNCTNYAAYAESTAFGAPAPSYLLGNAGQWAASAAAHGVPVNGTPAVGAVAEWDGGAPGMGAAGHVAVVERVGPGGSYIVISQQAIGSDPDGYDWTRINAGAAAGQWQEWPSHFIHFAGTGGLATAAPAAAAGGRRRGTGGGGGHLGRLLRPAGQLLPAAGRAGPGRGPDHRAPRLGRRRPAGGRLDGLGHRQHRVVHPVPRPVLPARPDHRRAGRAVVHVRAARHGATGRELGRAVRDVGRVLRPGDRDVPPAQRAQQRARQRHVPVRAAAHDPAGRRLAGPGHAGVGYYDPSTGTFHLRNGLSGGPATDSFQFGPPHMIPLAGDWAGAGHAGVGFYNPADGWFHLRDRLSAGLARQQFKFGPGGMVPLAGDWGAA